METRATCGAHDTAAARPSGRGWQHTHAAFAIALAVLLALLFAVVKPRHIGDVEEYALTTVALAQHASPDIRPADIASAKAQLPAFAQSLDLLAQGATSTREVPKPGYYRGHDGRVYAIHFFAYPALAALAYKALAFAGADPFRCFLAVNLAMVFVLGLALRRLFGSNGRAAFGVLSFLLCGGFLYGDWSSPETMCAGALLAALALYATGAPLAGGLLAGVAAMHNPPIVLFAAFAPMMNLCLRWRHGASLAAKLRGAPGPRELAGTVLTGGLFALPVLFNLWAFGVPSIIGKVSTAIDMASAARLFSFFFDLNQGMLVGVPGLAAALLAWGWRGSRRTLALTAGAALFSLALALPTLVAHNWNSACAGMMRYAFWGAMPLLFAVLWRLRERPHWPRSLLAMLVVVQLASIVHARSYNETEFSPLAKWVLAHAPGAYNPEPEVFMDRSTHVEKWLDASLVGRYEVDGVVVKQLFNLHNPAIDTALCGRGRTLAAGNNIASADRDWRYINGPIRCTAAAELPVGQAGLRMLAGWSYVEHGGGEWEGAWSASARARLSIEIDPPHRPAHLMLRGHYFDGNHRTRVTVDGVDLGWQQLDQQPALPVPPAPGAARALEVELEFDAPRVPRPGEPDQRQLAFFLQKVTTR